MADVHIESELYKPIPGYEDLYQITTLGRVYSTRRHMFLAGGKNSKGYRLVNLYRNGKGKTMKVHRLVATAFVPSEDGLEQVDHIDQNKTNNAAWNLRWASSAQNKANVARRRTNTSGYIGVTWNKQTGKWRATISVDGKTKHLGYFDDILEAAKAYDERAKLLRGDFAVVNEDEDNEDPLADFIGQTDRDDDPYSSDDSSIELIDSHDASPDTAPSFESRVTPEPSREIELTSSKSS